MKDQENCCEKKKCSKKKKILLWTLGVVTVGTGLYVAAKKGCLGGKVKDLVNRKKDDSEIMIFEEDIISPRRKPIYGGRNYTRSNDPKLNNR